uniref:Uncharacterized protein n=1 Tax=Arundo donax TaxID=35708 RepID=A0A0A9H8M6_ARUDO
MKASFLHRTYVVSNSSQVMVSRSRMCRSFKRDLP